MHPARKHCWLLLMLIALPLVFTGEVTRAQAGDDAAQPRLMPQYGTRAVTSVAISHDGRFVLTGGEDRTVGLWGTVSGKESGNSPDIPAWSLLSPSPRMALRANWELGQHGTSVGDGQREGNSAI